jgi:hypothetical protein
MAARTLAIVFGQTTDLLSQRAYLAKGALFVPAPEPPPEPFAEMTLQIEAPAGDVVELYAHAVQISPRGVALAFADLTEARAALEPLFERALEAPSREPSSDGTTRVFWTEPRAARTEVDRSSSSAADEALLYDQIRAMSSQEKIHLALHGDRPARMILLRDVNKTAQTFLVQNPRITIDEIRYLAGFRQANPDVLATIAGHREWGQNPGIVAALIRNPKTPSATAVKLLDKVAVAELRRLAKSNDVPRAVQAAARKRATE